MSNDDIDVLIDFEQNIMVVRVVDDVFMPSQLSIKAEILPMENSNEQDCEIAFAKVRFWLENIVTRCIIFGRNNTAALSMLISDDGKNNSGNLLMLTPDEPTDENLAILLQAKMNALACGAIIFGSVEIKSNNITGLRFTFIGESDDILPDMDTWIGKHTYFDTPWWNRDDASTIDVVPADDANLDDKPLWAYDLDFIAKAIRPKQEVVLRPDFKLNVIDGGKSDE